MAQVIEINRIEELDAFHLVWRKLWGETPRASFFQTLEQLQTYWQYFGQRQGLRVLLATCQSQVIGILPLVIRREKTRLGWVRVLTYPLPEGCGGFFAPIGKHSTATLLLALQKIAETPRDWDVLDLRWVDAERLDHGRTPTVMQQVGLAAIPQVWIRSVVVDTSGSWQDYWAGRPRTLHELIECAEKQLASLGDVSFIRYRPAGSLLGDDDPRWDLFDACMRLSSPANQVAEGEPPVFHQTERNAFLRQAHAEAVELGCAEVNLLQIDGVAVASAYNCVRDGRVCGVRLGVDPAYAWANPSAYLVYRMIEDSFQRGDEEIDLGPGGLGWKRPWGTALVESCRYTHFSSSPAAQLLRLKRLWDNRFRSREAVLARRSA